LAPEAMPRDQAIMGLPAAANPAPLTQGRQRFLGLHTYDVCDLAPGR